MKEEKKSKNEQKFLDEIVDKERESYITELNACQWMLKLIKANNFTLEELIEFLKKRVAIRIKDIKISYKELNDLGVFVKC